jgi:hypothetical protein
MVAAHLKRWAIKYKIMNDTDKRLKSIEEFIVIFSKARAEKMKSEQRDEARTSALLSMILELTAHAGMSQQQAFSHYKSRRDHFLDKSLRDVEDILPHRSAELDDRALSEVPVHAAFSPLFP